MNQVKNVKCEKCYLRFRTVEARDSHLLSHLPRHLTSAVLSQEELLQLRPGELQEEQVDPQKEEGDKLLLRTGMTRKKKSDGQEEAMKVTQTLVRKIGAGPLLVAGAPRPTAPGDVAEVPVQEVTLEKRASGIMCPAPQCFEPHKTYD